MTLDTQLIIDTMSKLFDEFSAGLFKQDVAREASRSVLIPTQSATVGADVVADNWGGLFDGGDNSVEQRHDEPIFTDNWGGLFEQPAQFQEERNLDTPAYVVPVPESCLTSTDPYALAGGAPATSSSLSSAPAPAPAARAAEEEIPTNSPTKCSTECLSHGIKMFKSMDTVTSVWNAPLTLLTFTDDSPLDINKDCSLNNLQGRYTTTTPSLSIGIVLPCVAISEYQQVLGSTVVFGPLSAHLFDKEQWPPPILGCNTLLSETNLLCFSFRSPISCGWASVRHMTPWPPPVQCELQVEDNHLRPTPWPSFNSLTRVLQWANVLSRVSSLFFCSVCHSMVKLLFEDMSGDCLQHWLELYGNALQIGGTKWRNSILSQFIGGPYAHPKKMGGQFSTFPDRANLATLQSHSVNCCWMQWEIPWPLAAMECWFGDGSTITISLQLLLLQFYTSGAKVVIFSSEPMEVPTCSELHNQWDITTCQALVLSWSSGVLLDPKLMISQYTLQSQFHVVYQITIAGHFVCHFVHIPSAVHIMSVSFEQYSKILSEWCHHIGYGLTTENQMLSYSYNCKMIHKSSNVSSSVRPFVPLLLAWTTVQMRPDASIFRASATMLVKDEPSTLLHILEFGRSLGGGRQWLTTCVHHGILICSSVFLNWSANHQLGVAVIKSDEDAYGNSKISGDVRNIIFMLLFYNLVIEDP